jgi:hypothetical protein
MAAATLIWEIFWAGGLWIEILEILVGIAMFLNAED